ncbi:SOS response-associated peptidase [bacterium]|nr:SOS response-associated peptidase [bacterium]QQR56205.1 MAG: SOS response-associated peptidase [Candidatus Melainabacteria bacterium]
MCGRYTLTDPVKFQDRFKLEDFSQYGIIPRFNVAPSQLNPVLIGRDGGIHLEVLQWGLYPKWAREKKLRPIINVRRETLADKPTFKGNLKRNRCLIPTDGYFEWLPGEKGKKIPMYFTLNEHRNATFAGLYQDNTDTEGNTTRQYAIITVPSSEEFLYIHDRMPAIMTPDTERLWLDPELSSTEELVSLLQPTSGEELSTRPVSSVVNSAKTNSPECIAPEAVQHTLQLDIQNL